MKKLIAVLLLGGLLLTFAGCGSQIEIRFTFKDETLPVAQTEATTQPPTTAAPETTTSAPETTTAAPNVDTGNPD